jgi:hypothetical protein
VAVAALIVAALALVFTVASFWWLYARRGSLEVGQPGAYSFAGRVRLRFPLALYNNGATALVVTDLRAVPVDPPERKPYRWLATVSHLRPDEDNERDFPTPFTVPGRGTREVVAEFEGAWAPVPGSQHRLRLEAKLLPGDDWTAVGEFEWWAPRPEAVLTAYLSHRNVPAAEQVEA